MASWYVATTGSDSNDGMSPATPFLTIQKAVSSADIVTHDTILVAAGTYVTPDPTIDAFAVVIDRAVTLLNDGSGNVVLDGNGTARSYISIVGAPSVFIQGPFEVVNTRWGGILFDTASS